MEHSQIAEQGTYHLGTYTKWHCFVRWKECQKIYVPKWHMGYGIYTRDCIQIVMEGLEAGKLKDELTVKEFIGNRIWLIPNFGKNALKEIFFNSSWTYEEYHSTLNDLAWEYSEGVSRNKLSSRKILMKISKLDNISGL